MTNGDKIRSMSDEDLALEMKECPPHMYRFECHRRIPCEKCRLNWLKEEIVAIRIRVIKPVRPLLPGFDLEAGKEYDAETDNYGNIAAVIDTGTVSVRQGEFELLSGPDWLVKIWKERTE